MQNGEEKEKHSTHNVTPVAGMYENWFLDYASYVILERAVPTIEDGLKPVQRRILHGVSKPLLQENVLPTTFSEINNQPSQIVWALLLAIVGFFCVYSLELFSKKKEETINT